MKVVKPISVTSSELISSSIAEPDTSVGEVEWVEDRFLGIGNIPTDINRGCYSVVRDGAGYLVSRAPNSGFGTSFIYEVDSNLSYNGNNTELNTGRVVDFVKGGNFFLSTISNFIGEYDSSGSFVASHDISTEIDRSGGICSDGASYYIFDLDSSKVLKYSSSFVYSGKSFEIAGGTGYAGALSFDNGLIHYIDRINAEAVSVDTTGKEISRVKINGLKSNNSDLWCVTRSGEDNFLITDSSTTDVYLCDSDYYYLAMYQVEDRATLSETHLLYQCSIKTHDKPTDGVKKVPPTWVEVGPTNRWSMFDNKRTVKSSSASAISVSLEFASQTDSINILSMENATAVSIVATSDSSGEVYNQTFDVTGQVDLVVLDVPPFDDLTYDVTVLGSQLKVGEIVVGASRELGTLVSGVVSDRIDYSRIEYDDFGNDEYIERPIVKYTTYPVMITKAEAPSVERYLDNLQKAQALWVGDTGGGDLLVTYGRLERSPITYSNPSIVEYQLKVRGSI